MELDYPIELYLLSKKKYPDKVVSFRSTALIILKKISNKFNLINFTEKNSSMGNFNKDRKKRINRYIKKLGVKSKII